MISPEEWDRLDRRPARSLDLGSTIILLAGVFVILWLASSAIGGR